MDREATEGNQAVGLHQRARVNHGSYRGPRKHLVNPTEVDVYTVPESSVWIEDLTIQRSVVASNIRSKVSYVFS